MCRKVFIKKMDLKVNMASLLCIQPQNALQISEFCPDLKLFPMLKAKTVLYLVKKLTKVNTELACSYYVQTNRNQMFSRHRKY